MEKEKKLKETRIGITCPCCEKHLIVKQFKKQVVPATPAEHEEWTEVEEDPQPQLFDNEPSGDGDTTVEPAGGKKKTTADHKRKIGGRTSEEASRL